MSSSLSRSCMAFCHRCSPWGLTVLRIAVGAILINHGWDKLFGDTTQLLIFFESTVLPAPEFMLMLAGIIELFGGAALVLGLFTRTIAFIAALEFVVIIFVVKLSLGYDALEYDILLLASLFAISCLGSGSLSLASLFKHPSRPEDRSAHGGHGAEAIAGRE